MPIINLIQEQRQAAQKRDQRARIALYTFLGVIATGVLGYGYIFFEKQALGAEATRLNTDIQKMTPIVTQIHDFEKQQSLLQPRLQTLLEAQKASDRWAHVLQHLQTQTPQGTWLTGMQCAPADPDKPTSFVLTGTARAQEPISEFILRVQNEPDLQNVALHFTAAKRALSGGKAIDFELGAELPGTEEKKTSLKEDTKS